jgi:rRNA maturation RNase YbeY
MQIELTNTQDQIAVNEEAVRIYAHWIMERVQRLRKEFKWTELSIVLTDDSIRALNLEWFGKDSVTDVISFAYPDSGNATGDTGEVILNVVQAREEGLLRASPDRELALYLAHGCHHLTGAEDDTPERKRAMLRLESAWVNKAESLNLAGPFFQ